MGQSVDGDVSAASHDVFVADMLASIPESDRNQARDPTKPFTLVPLTPEWECRREDILRILVNCANVPTNPFNSTLFVAVGIPNAIVSSFDMLAVPIIGVFLASDITERTQNLVATGQDRVYDRDEETVAFEEQSVGFQGYLRAHEVLESLWLEHLRETHIQFLPKTKMCYVGLCAIEPEYYGVGVTKQFMGKLFRAGVTRFVCICTNEFSAVHFRRIGGDLIASVEYDSFEVGEEGQKKIPFLGANEAALDFVRTDPSRATKKEWTELEAVATHCRLFECSVSGALRTLVFGGRGGGGGDQQDRRNRVAVANRGLTTRRMFQTAELLETPQTKIDDLIEDDN